MGVCWLCRTSAACGAATTRGHGAARTRASSNHQQSPQRHDRRPPAARLGRRVLEGHDKFRLFQYAAHDLSLHADAAPVNDAQSPESQLVRLFEVGFENWLHIARRHDVEIEDTGDRDADWLVAHTRIWIFKSLPRTMGF